MPDARPRYHFVSHWTVAAPPDAAYAAIYEVDAYPAWWPEVKAVRPIDADRRWLRTRSFLPYDLSFTLARTIVDPAAGILEAQVAGDLEGVIRWTIAGTAEGARLTFDEDVVTTKPLLNRLAPLVRPAYVANHRRMMAHGESGLRTFLAGYALARTRAAARSG
jgi:hypothetical protein